MQRQAERYRTLFLQRFSFSNYKVSVVRLHTGAVRREVTEAEGPHGEQWCVRTQCLFVNLCLCTQSRNTLIDALVWGTADSCKHRFNTHAHTHFYKCTSLSPARTHTHILNPLTRNTIKPFSDFAWTWLNMEHSLNINSGYIKAALCPTLLCCALLWWLSCYCARAAWVQQDVVWQRTTGSTWRPQGSWNITPSTVSPPHPLVSHHPSLTSPSSAPASVPCGTQQATRVSEGPNTTAWSRCYHVYAYANIWHQNNEQLFCLMTYSVRNDKKHRGKWRCLHDELLESSFQCSGWQSLCRLFT